MRIASTSRRRIVDLLQRNAIPIFYCLCFCTAALAAQEQNPASSSPPQTIRIEVQRVNVGVVVMDARGKFVQGLSRENFHVFDNAIAQPITDFAPIEEPAQVLLLIEAGPAVYLLQDAHLLAADALLNGLSAADRVAIARYDQNSQPVLNFTADKLVAQATLDQIRFNLGFGQLDLSTSLNTVLDWLAQVSGKKSIVLLSTGVDTSPPATIQALQARLLMDDVRVLCISLSGPLRNGKQGPRGAVLQTQQAFAAADLRLKDIAEVSGGHAYFPENAKAFQETYRQVAQLVRHEYSLAFMPPAHDGGIHSIEVKVNAGEASGKDAQYQVSHRRAYQAPSPNTVP